MTRRVTVLVLLSLALAGLTGCVLHGGFVGGGGNFYAPQPVCYDVIIGYVWDPYYGGYVPVYQTICQYESLTPEQVGDQEIAVVNVGEDNVLALETGAKLAAGQLIELKPTKGDSSFIRVEAVSKPETREVKE